MAIAGETKSVLSLLDPTLRVAEPKHADPLLVLRSYRETRVELRPTLPSSVPPKDR
jgi:hypothetical protein